MNIGELTLSTQFYVFTFAAVVILLLVGVIAFTVSARRSARQKAAAVSLEALIPDSRYVEINDVKIHYIQVGQGPNLVLLHGIGASLYIWRFLIPLLQSGFQITALDIPGFGKSSKDAARDYGIDAQAEILAKALTAIGIEKADLVGSSMGGAISLWMAKLYPERFKRVSVMSPATDSTFIPTQIKYLAAATPLFRKAMNRRLMKVFLAQVLSRRDLITDEVVDAYLEPFLDEGTSLRTFWSATTVLSDKRLPKDLKQLKSDVQIIYGRRDRLVTLRSMKRLSGIIPKANLVFHPTAGHHIMEDDPQFVAEQILRFLN